MNEDQLIITVGTVVMTLVATAPWWATLLFNLTK